MTVLIRQRHRDGLKPMGINFSSTIGRVSKKSTFEPPCTVSASTGPSFDLKVGAFTYLQGGRMSKASFGRYCSIAPEVSIGGAAHPTDWLSTSPFQYRSNWKGYPDWASNTTGADIEPWPAIPFSTSKGFTIIGNDVWIGERVTILSGVTIGDGAIIAAGAVVTKDIPPYAIASGIPATVQRFRFSQEVIDRLQQICWWRYAPWQLNGIDFSDIHRACSAIENLNDRNAEFWAPVIITGTNIEEAFAEKTIRN